MHLLKHLCEWDRYAVLKEQLLDRLRTTGNFAFLHPFSAILYGLSPAYVLAVCFTFLSRASLSSPFPSRLLKRMQSDLVHVRVLF